MSVRFALAIIATLAACDRSGEARAPGADSALVGVPERNNSTTRLREPAGTNACDKAVITKDRVGEIAIGDPVESLKKCRVIRDTVVPGGEGTMARKVFIAVASDTIAAEIVDGRVWRIEVSSPGVRTPESLGVGTTLRRLLELSDPRGASGEGRMFVLSRDYCGESFEIPYFPSIARGDWTRDHLAELPESTVVKRVLVSRCYPELYAPARRR